MERAGKKLVDGFALSRIEKVLFSLLWRGLIRSTRENMGSIRCFWPKTMCKVDRDRNRCFFLNYHTSIGICWVEDGSPPRDYPKHKKCHIMKWLNALRTWSGLICQNFSQKLRMLPSWSWLWFVDLSLNLARNKAKNAVWFFEAYYCWFCTGAKNVLHEIWSNWCKIEVIILMIITREEPSPFTKAENPLFSPNRSTHIPPKMV